MDPTSTAPPAPAGNGAGPDGAQPTGAAPAANQGGQGGIEEAVSGLFDLSSVPAELQPHVAEAIKKMQGGVTQKFQEHASERQRWEQYDQLGLSDYEPETIEETLALAQVLQQPQSVKDLVQDSDAFEDWWSQVGETMGFFADDGPEGGAPPEGLDPEQLEQQIRDKVMQELQPVFETVREQENAQRLQQANEAIDPRLAAVKAAHPDVEFTEEAEQAVLTFALRYDGEDDIERGLQDYLRIAGGAQRELVEAAQRQPAAPESGGSPPAGDDPVTSFDEAKRLGKARFAATT